MKWTLFLALFLVGCGSSSNNSSPTSNPPINDMEIQSGTYCSKVDIGSGISIYYEYQIVKFTSGDELITCSISGESYQSENSQYYRNGNAPTGQNCFLVYDLDTPSAGFWQFTSISGVNKTEYFDSGSTHNNYTYTFSSSDCKSL